MKSVSLDAYTSTDLLRALSRFDLRAKSFIIKPNFTQLCAGTTDEASLGQLFKALTEQPHEPEVWLAEIPNVNAPPLREVIKGLGLVGIIEEYGVGVRYLDELPPSEYEEFASLRIPRLFLRRREGRLIVVAPPKEHRFLPGGVIPSQLEPRLEGYSGVMKTLAVGVLHKDDKRKSHGVTEAIRERYGTENLRLLWSMMTDQEKGSLREEHNRIVHQILYRVVKPGDIFILTKRGMLGGHLNGTPVNTDRWIIGHDPRRVDELGVRRLIELKKSSHH
ncbi:MAG: hypothetical protein ACE5Z5_10540 [Candidatus Bathyarchaeia archaeon]